MVRFLVVDDDLTPPLGLNATQKMDLLTVPKENFVQLSKRYCYQVSKCLGKLPGKVRLQVDPSCTSVILTARKVPVSIREKFKAELQRLQDLRVITPVDQPTEWVSQFVVAVKKSGEVRVGIDPKELNAAL